MNFRILGIVLAVGVAASALALALSRAPTPAPAPAPAAATPSPATPRVAPQAPAPAASPMGQPDMRMAPPSVPTVTPKSTGSGARGHANQVWLDAKTNTYFCPDASEFGANGNGTYLSEVQARGKGARSAAGHACF